LEILSLPTEEDAYRLQRALAPLSPAYSSALSPPWRLVIQAGAYLQLLRRRIAGEKVLTFYCAVDKSYYGAVYINERGPFSAVQGQTREAVEQGTRMIRSLLQ